MFAFGLNNQLVDPSIGQFKVYQTTIIDPEAEFKEIESGVLELPVVLCNSVTSAS